MGKDATGPRATAGRMVELAERYLSGLRADQQGRSQLEFAPGDPRTHWAYTPGARQGLSLREMDRRQRLSAYGLVASGLSLRGFATATVIMSLENLLLREGGWAEEEEYDPQGYYLAIHGTPSETGPWGWRFEGHHLSVHYTLSEGRIVSPTPTFFGANPAEADLAGSLLLRPLAAAEDLARQLVRELDEEERVEAILARRAPPDLVTSNHSRVIEGSLPVPFS
jgi:hypothetical protein